MIVRTYGRRNRCLSRSYSDSSFNGGATEEEEEEDTTTFRGSLSQDSIYNFNFSSSQDSCPWSQFDSDSQPSLSRPPPLLPNPRSKKSKNLKLGRSEGAGRSNLGTSTLMEAQEFGEMMEHVDEVNFALDGLRKAHPPRIRRASLLSLLSICETSAQRRLLRTQGMAKQILDAILSLSLDDSLSTLAAAALFYVLASDGEDEQLLDSPICVRFLLKLLSPSTPITSDEKRPTVGSKLLALCRGSDMLGVQTKRLDASSIAIISKVQEILLNCKEIELSKNDDDGVGRPELTPKWIALLTMEKACLSTVSLEDTSAIVRKAGGNFKETLRELGGLDAVFDVAKDCHSIMERWLYHSVSSARELKDGVALETEVLLLKCLKIMENATFLSKDNQDHLLGMKGKLSSEGSTVSFTGLIISIIKILSGLSLGKRSSSSNEEKTVCYLDGMPSVSESLLEDGHKVELDGSVPRRSSRRCNIMKNASDVESFRTSKKRKQPSPVQKVYCVSSSEASFSADVNASHAESVKASQKNKKLSSAQTVYTVSSSDTSFSADVDASHVESFKFYKKQKKLPTNMVSSSKTSSFSADVSAGKDDKPSTSSYCNGTLNSSNGRISRDTCSLNKNVRGNRRSTVSEDISLEDSQDPFAFDEDEVQPSKWDKVSTKKEVPRFQKSKGTVRESRGTVTELEDGCNSKQITSQSESNDGKYGHFCDMTDSPSVEVENPNLLADCLLAAVKVLMNLTNDNPVGCQQIAACGGLETLSALISGHYPSFSTSISHCGHTDECILQPQSSKKLQHENDSHFTDREIDFLVTILGLLVNLVEKDSRNRSRLAATSVLIPTSGGPERENRRRDVIPLLCNIFLANQGAGETSEEGKLLLSDDETEMLQGEREGEKMIIEAYAALLLAFLSTESKNVRKEIARCLPDHNLEVLVPVLERFVAFHLSLNVISKETHTAVREVIESCKET